MSETLSVNSNLSHYRIVSKLGAGGMGEVWLAKDTRLDRKVAIKVLPEGFAEDAERVARFQREAHVLASLNHPNIGAIYGLEDSNGILALVMELVEGPTLADRIARGPIALDEAAPIAKQIAEGLEYAHERGVIHRDLKPANIKVTVDGGVKVLDFGLAKVFTEETHDSDLSHSPTLIKGTQAGMILGTAAYMSPEQAKGKAVDRRSDIWAFGCVLYEMLTGKQAFSGETLTDTLAAVVRAEPDWGELPEATPRVIRKLLARCLTKDLRQRLRDIGEARIVLDNPQDDKPGDVALQGAAKEARPFLDSFVWIAGIALAFLAGGVSVWFLRPASSEIPLRKLELHVPALDVNSSYGYSISPNGRMIAYVSNRRLWIRDLDRLEPREVASTEGAGHPFWSSDSAYLGYVIGKKIWKVPSVGSGNTVIADLPDVFSAAGGASWRSDGTIIFTTGGSGLMQVVAQGGDPSHLLNVEPDEADFHDVELLPDGRGVLFAVHRTAQGVDTIALFDGKIRKTLLQIESQRISNPVYCRTGHILFRRRLSNPGIWALPFSLAKLEVTGEPFLVAPVEGVPKVSDDGTLVFAHGEGASRTRLVWMDRTGKVVSLIQPDPLPFQLPSPRLSPDGKRVILATRESGKTDYRVVDLVRGARTRMTFGNSTAGGWFCSWTPNGQRVLYFSGDTPAAYEVLSKAADGSGEAKVLVKGWQAQFSPDGKFIIYTMASRGYLSSDLWYRAAEEGAQASPFLVTPQAQMSPEFSPDGRFVAYVSNESGRDEVYVKSFPGGEGKWQVSMDGGAVPRWSRRGDELFFSAGDNLMAVSVRTKPSLELGSPQRLFSRRPIGADRSFGLYDSYDVSPDGQRFVMLESAGEQAQSQPLTVIQNWFAEFKGRQTK